MGKNEEKSNELTKNQYLVQKIVKTRVFKGKKQLLVKWKGWSQKYNQWIPQNLIRPVGLDAKRQVDKQSSKQKQRSKLLKQQAQQQQNQQPKQKQTSKNIKQPPKQLQKQSQFQFQSQCQSLKKQSLQKKLQRQPQSPLNKNFQNQIQQSMNDPLGKNDKLNSQLQKQQKMIIKNSSCFQLIRMKLKKVGQSQVLFFQVQRFGKKSQVSRDYLFQNHTEKLARYYGKIAKKQLKKRYRTNSE